MPLIDIPHGGVQWDSFFQSVSQTGAATGNNELQNYEPGQVRRVESGGALELVLEKVGGNQYRSGKIKSFKPINALAPNHGAFQMEFVLPDNHMTGGGNPELVPGLWPAIWLLPDSGNWPTGGEIDLMEMMQFQGQHESKGFSTLHFGPSRGVDAIYDGHWGLGLASYSFSSPRGTQKLRFEWEHTSPNGPWKLTQWVNDAVVWEQLTSHTGPFKDFEKGKHFQRASPRDFAPDAPGDPVPIFQRAFDNEQYGMHLIINLAFGGTPWDHDRKVDLHLERSTMRIMNFQLWDLTQQTISPSIVDNHDADSQSENI